VLERESRAIQELKPSTLHLSVLRHLLDRGFAPSLGWLAQEFAVDTDVMARALLELQEIHGVVLHPHVPEVWIAHPFSTAPTPFAVKHGARVWWGNCAWCSLGVAALIGGHDVTIQTTLGAEGQPVTIHVENNTIREDRGVRDMPSRGVMPNLFSALMISQASGTAGISIPAGPSGLSAKRARYSPDSDFKGPCGICLSPISVSEDCPALEHEPAMGFEEVTRDQSRREPRTRPRLAAYWFRRCGTATPRTKPRTVAVSATLRRQAGSIVKTPAKFRVAGSGPWQKLALPVPITRYPSTWTGILRSLSLKFQTVPSAQLSADTARS
jgi:hypothetical protein